MPCLPSPTPSTTEAMQPKPMHVVVAGAGPGGLLCAINLLRRNIEGAPPRYTVEIVDSGEDLGLLDFNGLQRKRSWMIGLAWPGLRAIRRVPGLYEKYVSLVGVEINQIALYFGSSKMASASGEKGASDENYLVDRNFIVAALARYLNEHFGESKNLTRRYSTRVNFVDADARRVFVRAADGTESYLSYDLLVGADGVRSAVRAALIANHRDFDCAVSDIFERFKAVTIELPPGVEPNCMHVFPNCMKHMNGIGLVATGGRINISIGHRLHQPCDEALHSNDANVVATYMRKNFRAIPLPYEEVAKEWVAKPWNSTTMVHCNFYHSEKLQLVIMGDAAHATSPSIGMGMNHALGDAAVLDELLAEHNDDLARVLPAFSAARVKEGNALTDLADLIQSYSGWQNTLMTIRQLARGFGHYMLPSIVAPEPYMAIGNGMKLSEAYAELVRMGRIEAIRRNNAAIKQQYFAQITGMLPARESHSIRYSWLALLAAVAGAFVAMGYSKY